jgi:hypothetical protein
MDLWHFFVTYVKFIYSSSTLLIMDFLDPIMSSKFQLNFISGQHDFLSESIFKRSLVVVYKGTHGTSQKRE